MNSFVKRIENCRLMASELYHGCKLDDEKYEEIVMLLDCAEEADEADIDLLDEIECDLDACIDAVAPYRTR